MENEAVPKNDNSQNVRIATVRQADSRVSQAGHTLEKDSRSHGGNRCRCRLLATAVS